MKNTFWSDCIQGVGTLYLSRQLRFSDQYREAYRAAFGLEGRRNILEIGCGPGALAQALARWYPEAQITGIDRDAAFIQFAARQAPQISFLEADAAALPFEEGAFDATISNTVQEHMPPEDFFGQQYRVLKPGGICLVLSARRGVSLDAPCLERQEDLEREIWARAEQIQQERGQSLPVGQYFMSESQLPAAMERFGFRQVSAQYLAVNLTPDNPDVSPEQARAMIEAHRQTALDAVDSLPHIAPGAASERELAELRRLVNQKYDRRIQLYQAGEKQWDTSVSLTMVLRGVK